MRFFNKIGIVGLGLIGGSIALAVKERKLAKEIKGVSRHTKTLLFAKKIGAVDKVSKDFKILKDVELLILACPVRTILEISSQIVSFIPKDCLVTDVGSTKEEIVFCLEKIFNCYLGSHPLAGSEKRGIEYASGKLFENSLCILTPTKNTKDLVKNRITEFWQALGMKVVFLSPSEHDKILSLTSHLPHLLSFLILNMIPLRYLKFSGSGLKDFIRLAGSNAEVWVDIFLSNQKNLISNLEDLEKIIKELKLAFKQKNNLFLSRFIKKANLKYNLLK